MIRHSLAILFTLLLAISISSGALAENVLTVMTHPWIGLADTLKLGGEIFEEENPGWKADFIIGLRDELIAMTAGGTPPDLACMIGGERQEYLDLDMLSPAPPIIEQDLEERFIPQTYQHLYHEGRIYGYPTEFQVITLLANLKLFDTMGMAFEQPEYWTDLERFQKQMIQHDSEGNTERAAISLARRGIWGLLHFTPIFWGCGATYLDSEGRPALNSPEGLDALELLRKLALPDIGAWDFFSRGTIGFILHTPTARWDVSHSDAPLSVEVVDRPLKDPSGREVTAFYTWDLHVIKGSKNTPKAWELAKCINSEKVKYALTENIGYLPVTREVLDETLSHDPWFEPFFRWSQGIQQWPNILDFYNHTGGGIADRAVLSQVELYLNDEMDPRTALINAERLLKAELAALERQ